MLAYASHPRRRSSSMFCHGHPPPLMKAAPPAGDERISSLNLLQRRLDRGDTDVQRFVASAMEGANRAASLTSRLLAFSRQQPLAPEVLDANQLVAGMSELLQHTLGEAIKIETVLAVGLWKT